MGARKKIDLTTRVLMDIRDATRQTTEQLGKTNERLESLERRQTEGNERLAALERRQTEAELRLATEVTAVAYAVGEVRDLLRESLRLTPRLENHEQRIASLERKVG